MLKEILQGLLLEYNNDEKDKYAVANKDEAKKVEDFLKEKGIRVVNFEIKKGKVSVLIGQHPYIAKEGSFYHGAYDITIIFFSLKDKMQFHQMLRNKTFPIELKQTYSDYIKNY